MKQKPFTPKQEEILLNIWAKTPKHELLQMFPENTIMEINNCIANHNELVKKKKKQGEIIRKDRQLRFVGAPKVVNMSGWKEYDIPLLKKPVITENIYAFRTGFELKASTFDNSRKKVA